MNNSEFSQALIRATYHFNVTASPTTINTLIRYTQTLQKWRRSFNLTASLQPEDWWVHLYDSIALAHTLPLLHVKQCTDIGSGAGFPAIICAIVNPNIQFTLCEIDLNKSAFLRQVVIDCEINNVKLTGDWQRANPPFTCVTSKAFLTLEQFIQNLPHLIAVGGKGLIFSHDDPSTSIPQNLLKSTIYFKVPPLKIDIKQSSFNAPHTTRSITLLQR